MKFRNKENGHIEEKSLPALWCFLFGGLYFLVSGIWIHTVVMFIGVVSLFAVFGAPGTLLVILLHVVYCLLAPSIVRSYYLRKGWEEISDASVIASVASKHGTVAKTRPCPFCGEEIMTVAVKCKHCQSVVERGDLESKPIPADARFFPKPDSMTHDAYENEIMQRNGATIAGFGISWEGKYFKSFADLLQAIEVEQSEKATSP